MGTVGLNFGSPTSGTGFDVSSTVSQIVTNLQRVETPWKTQLTALQSQDTAISSLGTLFSNLSKDIGSLTDLQGIMAQKEGSSSDQNVLTLTAADSSAIAGTHTVTISNLAQTSSGYLAAITNASDKLSGSLTLQAGSGKAQTITLNSSNNTLAGLAAAINSSGVGISASVLTDSSGSRLSLVSGISGKSGGLTVSANSIADVKTPGSTMGFTSTVTGKDANLTVDGIALTSASNTVANLIPGVTFQLLAPSATESDGSLEQIQVVIANDNSGVVSAVQTMVTDYNSAISAINAQEKNDSTGQPQPLFGSPTLSLLQQQLLGALNTQNPNGFMDSISSTNGTTLSGSLNVSVGSGSSITIVAGSGSNSAVPGTYYTDNTDSGGVNNGNTLAGLAATINAAQIGFTAGVATTGGRSTLTLSSQKTGASGALSVTSALVATSPTALKYSDLHGYTNTTADSGTLGTVPASGAGADTLTGSITIQAGSGTAMSFNLSSLSDPSLNGLAAAINDANIGVTATVVQSSDGTTSSISLVSDTVGAAGALTVKSSILDTTNLTNTTLNYNNSSDIGTLSSLGISVNNDGSLTLDTSALNTLLNSDYSGVVGFFQNANSWGRTFSTMLNNAGSTSATGVLALAAKSNSNIETMLNSDISKEEKLIAAQKKTLTTELNLANQIMQALPSQLAGIDELYSAITGYNQAQH